MKKRFPMGGWVERDRRVVAFSCVFNSDVLPRGLERSLGSPGQKKSPLEKSQSGRVRLDARSRSMLDASPFPFSIPDLERSCETEHAKGQIV